MTASLGIITGPVDTPQGVHAFATSWADNGEPLGRLLDHLDDIWATGDDPDRTAELSRVASLAWADAFAGRLNRLTCHDPLTGLVSSHHLVTYFQGLVDGIDAASTESVPRHAVVLIDLTDESGLLTSSGYGALSLARSITLAVVSEVVGAWVDDGLGVASMLTARRVAVLVEASPHLDDAVSVLERQLTQRLMLAPERSRAAASVLDLPADAASAVEVLRDLASGSV